MDGELSSGFNVKEKISDIKAKTEAANLIHGYGTGDDICFLDSDEAYKLPECICALANSSGGFVVIDSDSLPEINIPSEIDCTLQALPDERYAIHVQPLKWHDRPAMIHNRVYRRVEGENIVSGRYARSIMSMDALSLSRDDFPVKAKLDEECMNEFRDSVLKLHPDYANLNRDEFFKRTYIYSGRHLTFAGALMFGKFIRVRVKVNDTKIEAYNIWRSYTDILPRLTQKLSDRCACALREAFINSLLHSDYNISRSINVTVKPRPLRAIIDNPSIIRGITRNHRLEKIFMLSGISSGTHKGIERIKHYAPNFRLEQDMLNFRVKAIIPLEGIEALPEVIML